MLAAFIEKMAVSRPDMQTIDKTQLQSQQSFLKKKYSIFIKVKNNSGFGWDDLRKMVIAPDLVWDAYLAENPDAKEFRTNTLF